MPRTVQSSQKQPLDGSLCDKMLSKKLLIPAGLLIVVVVIVGLGLGLYFYLIQTGPTAEITVEPILSTTIEPTPSIVTEPIPSTTSSTTHSTTSEPPATVPGLFVATSTNLIALNLVTLLTTNITNKSAFAVAVNNNLNKVYWYEGGSVILRSNFDGSVPETFPKWPGGSIYTMAIDEISGNIYYSQSDSDQILMCNLVGILCSVIIPQSAIVVFPINLAVDSRNSVIYLSGYDPPSDFICTNLEGENNKTIDGGFFGIRGIAIDKNSSDVLYWIDAGRHTIGKIGVNGQDKRTLIHKPTLNASYIQVDAHMIYFVADGGIQSANKLGQELKTLLNVSVSVNGLALFNALV